MQRNTFSGDGSSVDQAASDNAATSTSPKSSNPSVVSQQDQEHDAPLPIGHVSEVLIAIASTLIWSYGVI